MMVTKFLLPKGSLRNLFSFKVAAALRIMNYKFSLAGGIKMKKAIFLAALTILASWALLLAARRGDQ
jgi:hypothetical protein